MNINEEIFEDYIQNELISLGWHELLDKNLKRADNQESINFSVLKKSIIKINNVDSIIADKAINEIRKISDSLLEMNIKATKLLREGIKIYDSNEDRTLTINLISEDITINNYQTIRQLKISNGRETRIPDIVLYVNGLPLVVMELKSPTATDGIEEAYKQNESLKRHNPKLWIFNVVNFLSNNLVTKYGSITSTLKHFYGWKKWELLYSTNPIHFLFNKKMIFKLINLYSFYAKEHTSVKYLAAPHQILAVEKTIIKLQNSNDTRGGVIWHTQGSGKSVTMVILTKAIRLYFPKSTILLVTDRNSLDQQLHQRFLNAEAYLRNKAISIESRKDLIKKLNDKKHFGIFFTTVQKFAEQTGVLSKRKDIFILVDEAHRSQNNLDGERVISKAKEEVEIKFGYARYMRDAFPNAKITGFTGTPLMSIDKDTREVFGEYNHTYTMNQSVEDGSTVPIHYEMRKLKMHLNDFYLKEMDDIQNEYLKTLDPNDLSSEQKIDTLIKSINRTKILEDDQVIKAKANDMIEHLEKRKDILHGKAMIVTNSRKAAHKYFKSIIENFPKYQGKVILVITSSNKDTEKIANAIVAPSEINKVATEFRKSNSQYKVAIVVDMWLTGFDVPDLDVMYIDKIIKWHNLMQAIARVNRTYEDKQNGLVKENGLIVDYIGIWKYLSEALMQYASNTDQQLDINIEDIHKAQEKLNEAFDILEDNYIPRIKKFDLLDNKEKYKFIMSSLNIILSLKVEEKNKFIKLARKTKRFFKIAYSIINDKESIISKGIELINSLLTSSNIQGDENLILTIEMIKNAIEKTVSTSPTDVNILESKINKDINKVSRILAEEAENLIKENPRVAVELLKHSLLSDINEMKRIRPVFAKKASDKLRDLINELEKTEEIERIIEKLKDLAKEILSENEKDLTFNDPQLQAFFEVLSSEEFSEHNINSEILRKIAEDLMNTVKENITEQYWNNPKVREKVQLELIKILKNKYNYPLNKQGENHWY